jgi:hypothetical protein
MQEKLKERANASDALGGNNGGGDDAMMAGYYTTYEVVVMYMYTYVRAIVGFTGMNVCWSAIISLMNNHIGNGGNDKTEQGVYIIVGFTLVNLFGTSSFADEAGVDLSDDASDAAIKKAKLGHTTSQFIMRECWRNFRTALYLFGMIVFWTAVENILLIQPDTVELYEWAWIMIGTGIFLLLITGTFFSVVGVPPPAFIMSHLDPRVGSCFTCWWRDGGDHRVPIMIPGDERSFRQLPGRVSCMLSNQVDADGSYQPPTLMKRNPVAKFEPGTTPRESTFNLVDSDSDSDDDIFKNHEMTGRNEFSLRPPGLKQESGKVAGATDEEDDSD